MGELLDREFQRTLLRQLQELYPSPADIARSWGKQTDNRLLVNLSYLDDHGLVDFKRTKFMSGEYGLHNVAITAKGMDFIADDGGLSAILGVITVKLHDDTIRALLIKKVEEADGDKSAKELLIAKIKEVPADALGALTMAGLDAGLSQVPNLLGLLRGILHV